MVAVVLPSTVLVALGVQLMRQERELAIQQAANERRLVVSQARQTLFAKLEQVQREVFEARTGDTPGFGSTAFPETALVLATQINDGVLRLPWMPDRRAELGRTSLRTEPFARRVARGKRAEFVGGDAARAIELYEDALAGAQDSIQAAYARLLLARALGKSGRRDEAISQNQRLLALPPHVTDEVGIPIALFAAGRLLDELDGGRAVIEKLGTIVNEQRWRSPAEAYMLRDLLDEASTTHGSSERQTVVDLQQRIGSEIAVIERVIDLRNELPGLGLRFGGTLEDTYGSRWIRWGDDWLVGSTPIHDDAWGIVAFSIRQLLALAPALPNWPGAAEMIIADATEPNAASEPLDPAIAEVRIAVLDDALPGSGAAVRRRGFYVGALLLVLSVTLFGAYLFWLDVRRELRMGELRTLFVSSVSHELKTPLTAIRMFAERLQLKKQPDPKMQTEYLATIVGESERLTRLLNNVLDLSKIEQAQKRYRQDPVELADVVDRTVRAIGYPLARGGFTLNVDVDGHPPRVHGDADALEQALLNLLSNAMKYSGENREIDLRLFVQNGAAVIEVSDRGVGIPTAVQERLTEKFYRVPTAENERIPGTGLGLALVHHAVEAHGGHLTIQSAEGEGSTFAIHLPLETR
ncbi:MAG: ATP-binding protein [Gammaproteobacteria bacterium]|nr:ATP-binding protein [Gammaproteobacteria bacterium]